MVCCSSIYSQCHGQIITAPKSINILLFLCMVTVRQRFEMTDNQHQHIKSLPLQVQYWLLLYVYTFVHNRSLHRCKISEVFWLIGSPKQGSVSPFFESNHMCILFFLSFISRVQQNFTCFFTHTLDTINIYLNLSCY